MAITNVLALDTSTRTLSCALKTADTILTHNEDNKQKQSEIILQVIDDLFNTAHLSIHALDLILLTQGPGSFTGLRLGCSIVQAMVMALKIPVQLFSSLALLAQTAYRTLTIDGVYWVSLEASSQHIYSAVFDCRNKTFSCLHADCLLACDQAADFPTHAVDVVIGPACQYHTPAVKSHPTLLPAAIDLFELQQQIPGPMIASASAIVPNYLNAGAFKKL